MNARYPWMSRRVAQQHVRRGALVSENLQDALISVLSPRDPFCIIMGAYTNDLPTPHCRLLKGI